MAGFIVSEHTLNALRGFRPFLGPAGGNCIDLLESLEELLGSSEAQKIINSLRFLGSGEFFKTLEMRSEAAGNPYFLFLILLLLLMADGINAPVDKSDGLPTEERPENGKH